MGKTRGVKRERGIRYTILPRLSDFKSRFGNHKQTPLSLCLSSFYFTDSIFESITTMERKSGILFLEPLDDIYN